VPGCKPGVSAAIANRREETAALRRVGLFGFDGVRDVKPQLAKFQAQGLPGNP
jgi:hypothetical protein